MNIESYSPLRARKAWYWINIICTLWSLLLFVQLLSTLGPLERLEGTRAYLVYNFGTTLIWVAEVSLTVLDMQKSNLNRNFFEIVYLQTSKDVELLVELAAAIYFLFSSMEVFYHWEKADMRVGEQSLDAFMNFLAYSYAVNKSSASQAIAEDYVDILDEESYLDPKGHSDSSSSGAIVAWQ